MATSWDPSISKCNNLPRILPIWGRKKQIFKIYPFCIWYINISLSVGWHFVIITPQPLLPFFATWEHFLSECAAAWLRTCRSSAVATLSGRRLFSEVNAEKTEDILSCTRLRLSLILSLLSHHKDPRRRIGPSNLPCFHRCFPKHSWNVSGWKTPFHPESPTPHTPTAPWPAEFHSLKENRKVYWQSVFSALKFFTFCTYAEPQNDLPERSVHYHQIQLSAPSKTPSPLGHANCSHCLCGWHIVR